MNHQPELVVVILVVRTFSDLTDKWFLFFVVGYITNFVC